MAEELKACPFCDGVPKTSHRPESEAAGGGHKAFVVCYCGGYASTAHQMGHAETVQAAIAEAVEKWNTRAQLPSQGGEAVAYLDIGAGGYVDLGTDQPIEALEKLPYGRHMLGIIGTYGADGWKPSTSQSASKPEPVAYAAFADNGNIRVWSRGANVIETMAAQGCKAVPLYTHPADQVEDDLTMVKVSRELLQDLRDLAFDQVEHHRAAMGAYKQTRQSAMDSVLAQADALLRT